MWSARSPVSYCLCCCPKFIPCSADSIPYPHTRYVQLSLLIPSKGQDQIPGFSGLLFISVIPIPPLTLLFTSKYPSLPPPPPSLLFWCSLPRFLQRQDGEAVQQSISTKRHIQGEVCTWVYATPESIHGKINPWDLLECCTYREVSAVFLPDLN